MMMMMMMMVMMMMMMMMMNDIGIGKKQQTLYNQENYKYSH